MLLFLSFFTFLFLNFSRIWYESWLNLIYLNRQLIHYVATQQWLMGLRVQSAARTGAWIKFSITVNLPMKMKESCWEKAFNKWPLRAQEGKKKAEFRRKMTTTMNDWHSWLKITIYPNYFRVIFFFFDRVSAPWTESEASTAPYRSRTRGISSTLTSVNAILKICGISSPITSYFSRLKATAVIIRKEMALLFCNKCIFRINVPRGSVSTGVGLEKDVPAVGLTLLVVKEKKKKLGALEA